MGSGEASAVQSDTSIQSESIADTWDEALPLILKNHQETGLFESTDFNPSCEMFADMQDRGIARCYTMRVGGRLVGYGLFALMAHPWYPTRRIATAYAVFVAPECRGRRAIRFLLWCDEQLEQAGAFAIGRQVRPACDYSRTLERLGYTETERSYMKRLG